MKSLNQLKLLSSFSNCMSKQSLTINDTDLQSVIKHNILHYSFVLFASNKILCQNVLCAYFRLFLYPLLYFVLFQTTNKSTFRSFFFSFPILYLSQLMIAIHKDDSVI